MTSDPWAWTETFSRTDKPTAYEGCRAAPYPLAAVNRQCWREAGHEPPHRDPWGGEWADAAAEQEGSPS